MMELCIWCLRIAPARDNLAGLGRPRTAAQQESYDEHTQLTSLPLQSHSRIVAITDGGCQLLGLTVRERSLSSRAPTCFLPLPSTADSSVFASRIVGMTTQGYRAEG